ncbi:hypothetical protein [Candidatus Lokiarchaeum ossiferum]
MYYSDRHGIERPQISFEMIKRRIYGLFKKFERKGYFQGAFGYDCVDNGVVYGDKEMTFKEYLDIELNLQIDFSKMDDFLSLDEGNLFNLIEFFYINISKPTDSYYHNFGDCGLHVHESDYDEGRTEFQTELNKILPYYEKEIFLNSDGHIENVDVDLRERISTASVGQSNFFTFIPSVFDKPVEDPDENLVSVMMPFSMEFNQVHLTIKEACSESSIICKRVDDMWENSILIQDIFKLIYISSIVICDFTNKNPNVFYEAGIAHTLGKFVIPITQNMEHIPFDLRHHRCVTYLPNGEGLGELKTKLIERINFLKRKL